MENISDVDFFRGWGVKGGWGVVGVEWGYLLPCLLACLPLLSLHQRMKHRRHRT